VSETHFTNKTVSLDTHCITQCTDDKADDKAYGGTAVIIRSDIKHYEIDKFQREFLQAISIVIEDQKLLYYYFSHIITT